MRYNLLFILPLIAIIAVVGIIVWRFLKNKRKINNKSIVAHTAAIRELPEYKKALLLYRILIGVAAVVFIVCYTTSTIIASRPLKVTLEDTVYDSRDIMICLDVSGSMYSYLEDIIDYFNDITTNLKGQRIGITLFDSTSVSITPLSNDYAALSEITEELRDHLSDYSSLARSGAGSSFIGNGLISCVNNFDKLEDEERTRTIILATDNMGPEKSDDLATLTQAAEYAKRFNITIYSLDTMHNANENEYGYGKKTYENSPKELFDAAVSSGGVYYSLKSGVDTKEIVRQIMAQDENRNQSSIKTIKTDSPNAAIIVLVISTIAILVLIWRLKL